jgi:hypothetical protein
MPYGIAGIDVHKKMLAVAVADVEVEGAYHFERLKVGTSPVQLRALADWLVEHEGRGSGDGIDRTVLATGLGGAGAVLETEAPERAPMRVLYPARRTLHKRKSNRGAGGRKRDFPDAEPPQPAGVAPRGSSHQGIECRVRSAGYQRTSHAARGRRRCNGSDGAGRTGRSAIAGNARAIA